MKRKQEVADFCLKSPIITVSKLIVLFYDYIFYKCNNYLPSVSWDQLQPRCEPQQDKR